MERQEAVDNSLLDNTVLTSNDQFNPHNPKASQANGKKATGYENLGRHIQMSLNFFVLFCSFFLVQNVASLVQSQAGLENLGFITLATLYFSIGVCSFFSAAIYRRLGAYKCFLIGGLSQFIFVAAQIFPAYRVDNPDVDSAVTSKKFCAAILLISALINGVGTGILFVANGSYIA